VASRFLRRLFGGHDPLPTDLAEARAELDAVVASRPSLAGPAAILREILPQPDVAAAPFGMSPDAAAAKLAGGVPLLRGESLTLDDRPLRRRWQTVCTAIARHDEPGPATALARALKSGALPPGDLLGEVLAGHPDAAAARAAALSLEPSLTATVLRLTVLPALARLAADLEALLEQARWDYGYCPVCGSWPLLGEFRGLEQTRVLRCALCAAGWDFARLRCPFCDCGDHRQLGYLHVEGEEDRYRAATCDACRGYVKMVATLAALPLPRLLVADQATLHLDLAAAERGYYVR
jgi:FdhE protein